MAAIVIVLLLALLLLPAAPVRVAQANAAISVTGFAAESRAPKAVVVRAHLTASAMVNDIALHLRMGSGTGSMLVRPDFTPGTAVAIDYEISTSGTRFVPPGSEFELRLEARDAAGNHVMTGPVRLTYLAPQFDWKTATARGGLISVYYYGDALERAQRALRGAEAALEKMEEKAGVALGQPFRLIVFTSPDGWRDALPPAQSRTFEQQVGYAGLAYGEYDLVMMQATRPTGLDFVESVAAHEVTHLVVHRAAGNGVAAWLNEGLAGYGEPRSGANQDRQVRAAAENNQLLLTRAIQTQPGQASQVGLFYAQGYSLAKFLLENFPAEQMRGLLASLKNHESLDRALRQHYGFDQDGLDAAWRTHIGAPPRDYASAVPTPIAPPQVGVMTQPPRSDAEQASGEGESAGVDAAAPRPPFALVGVALIVLALAGGAVVALRGGKAA